MTNRFRVTAATARDAQPAWGRLDVYQGAGELGEARTRWGKFAEFSTKGAVT